VPRPNLSHLLPPGKLIVFGIFLILTGAGVWYVGSRLSNDTLEIVGILVSLSGVSPLLSSSKEAETYDRELRSEERRAVILLGFLGGFIAFDFWLRDSDPHANPTFNFVCNSPCPHVTFYWIPFLDRLIYFWFLWAVCSLVYFSQDLFHTWRFKQEFRQVFRNLGHGFLILWPTLFAWTVIFSEGEFLIESAVPPWILTLYALFGAWVLGSLVLWLVETVTGGQRGTLRWLVRADLEGIRAMMEFVMDEFPHLIEMFARRFLKGRVPRKLRTLWFVVQRLLLIPPRLPKRRRSKTRKWESDSWGVPSHPI
jgi:hypothetical protein